MSSDTNGLREVEVQLFEEVGGWPFVFAAIATIALVAGLVVAKLFPFLVPFVGP